MPVTKQPKEQTRLPAARPIKEPAEPAKKPKPQTPTRIKTAAEPAPVPTAATQQKPPSEPSPLLPKPLGRLVSGDQVLLSNDPAGGWMRVGPKDVLVSRQLLVLPTYRAKVAFTAAGVSLEILGGTRFELLGGGGSAPAGIRILYGRVVLAPLAKDQAQLSVAFGDRAGRITLVDPGSVAAIDVRRIHATGMNPESEPSRITADLFVAGGEVLWAETDSRKGKAAAGGKPLLLASPQRLSFDGELTAAPVAGKQLPPWIVAEPMTPLDGLASPAIAKALPTDQVARVSLLELATSRPQKEVKWLSLRCLGYVGQFRDMVAALGDAAHKLDWPDYIDELRAAVARDAETAAAVRLALETQYPARDPEREDSLYRMLWGYTNKDLKDGKDAKLVNALDDNDVLAARVLAIWNLKDVTGLGGLYYRPEDSAAKRMSPTQRWRQRLKAKEIRLKDGDQ